jgi:uncharacterized membrane protein YebE (DUF533 family)
MSDRTSLPAPPDPLLAAQWAGQIRTLIALLAGAGVVGGAWVGVSTEQIANALTALMTIAGIVAYGWAAYKSYRDKIAQRAVVVASAQASAEITAKTGVVTPVSVVVTPEGMPNVATKISPAEVAQAPSAPMNVPPSPAPAA